jgi:hypothetical protein
MDRRTYPLPGDVSHQGMAFRMAGSKERDEYLKTFPHPVPSTHTLHWEWDVAANELRFEMRPRPAQEEGEETEETEQRPATTTATARSVHRELEAMTAADLLTRGAEVGAAVNGKMTKAALVAAILEALAKQPQGK